MALTARLPPPDPTLSSLATKRMELDPMRQKLPHDPEQALRTTPLLEAHHPRAMVYKDMLRSIGEERPEEHPPPRRRTCGDYEGCP